MEAETACHCETERSQLLRLAQVKQIALRLFSVACLHVPLASALVSIVHTRNPGKADPTAPHHILSNREEEEPLTAFEAQLWDNRLKRC
jgi:hypothetical protein